MDNKPALSVVLIVMNEEDALRECLETVSWADEIVIIDSGSRDRTREIAAEYTDKVYVEDDWQGFGVQRQRAQQYVTGDWILMLDADERITEPLAQQIRQAVEMDDRQAVYFVPRLSWVFGRFIRHSGWYPDYVARLYPREQAGYNDNRVHEKLVYPDSMKEKKLAGDLLHYTYRDLEHYLVKSAHYAAAWAQQRQERGKRSSLLQGMLHGLGCFIKMYLVRAGFLDGKQGFLLAVLSAHSTFAKYADLWIRQQSDHQ
ncbi:MAG: glycosyltransferase family 2 protein [Thiohalophilus sp.]|uniref:glycosyltransferase family 2 protein n=1 Tax=Thiohalophilus sp. TaxID=3028392 RepID=UPI00286FFF03|nr:glycosyltransferase family 2 protein [Thiohalophilus sp.]MDR9437530.1 glycosyltransferase family 2 protein [Thiohalophilus sp.]